MKKILMSGGTSLVGSAIARGFLSRGYDVTCICRLNSRRINNVPKEAHLIDCSLESYESLNIEDSYDAFIHCAWASTTVAGREDVDVQYKNVGYTLSAVRLAKRAGCKVFIGAGSQSEYGVKNEPLSSETPVNPTSPYGIAKYAAERFSMALCKQQGLRFNWLRILSVFGPNDGATTLMTCLMDNLRAGNSPELTKCEQVWDYLYCDDCASAFVAVAEKAPDGKVYALGSGEPRTLKDYVLAAQKIVAPETPLLFGKKDYYPHQPMYLVADIKELKNDTGWKPVISFEEGVRLTLDSLSR